MQNVFQLMLSYINKTTTDCIQFLSKICPFFSNFFQYIFTQNILFIYMYSKQNFSLNNFNCHCLVCRYLH